MKKLLSIVALSFFLTEGYAQRTASVKKVVKDSVSTRLNISDTTQLLAKRDTAALINSIKNNTSGFEKYTTLSSSTTLTSVSPSMLYTINTITITLPDPATCVSSGTVKKFTFIKLELGATTLTINNHFGTQMTQLVNKYSNITYITDGVAWFAVY